MGVYQIEQARLVQQYCDKAEACVVKQDYRTVSNWITYYIYVVTITEGDEGVGK